MNNTSELEHKVRLAVVIISSVGRVHSLVARALQEKGNDYVKAMPFLLLASSEVVLLFLFNFFIWSRAIDPQKRAVSYRLLQHE